MATTPRAESSDGPYVPEGQAGRRQIADELIRIVESLVRGPDDAMTNLADHVTEWLLDHERSSPACRRALFAVYARRVASAPRPIGQIDLEMYRAWLADPNDLAAYDFWLFSHEPARVAGDA